MAKGPPSPTLRRRSLAVDNFINPERVAERTDARHEVVPLILDAESDSRHLFGGAIDRLDPGRECEIAESLPFKNQQGEMLVRRVARQLGQHLMPGRHRQFRVRWRGGAGHVFNHLPIPGLALAGNRAAEAGWRLVQFCPAEIEIALRAEQGPRGDENGETTDGAEHQAAG